MYPQSTLTPSKALKGVHGVHLAPQSPFVLEEINQNGNINQPTCQNSALESSQRLIVRRVWEQRPSCLRPIQCCVSVFFKSCLLQVIGTLQKQLLMKNLNCKLYASSLIGVGIASSMYHASRGKLRRYLRWADYTMIATSTVFLSRALRNENPKLLMAASALILPVQPLMVSALHTGMMEVVFAKRALEDPELRTAHNVHKMSSVLGGALFIADDVFPDTPFLHAAWHLAAAVGVGTCNKLL
ncbi:hypothetical protein RHGRI_026715 [Rhododendron griersonianum]|uniref:Uncharacterized protein n=1 Tax=Rhododendron griersonianum TaxID=479676 RepID=A0AAV6ITX2_9ERIC|nr:hypothetical protein RHGRI_026715 [Rhododendron griersonianum]